MESLSDKRAATDSDSGPLTFVERRARPLAVIFSIAVWILIFWAWSSYALADVLEGRVVGVADGDTLTVLDASQNQHKIRLMGIDAPEKGQPFGNRSKQHLSDLVFGAPVNVDWTKRDRYGRIIGRVWVAPKGACAKVAPGCPKTLDAGLAMIAAGLAWHYKQYEKEQTEEDRERYAFAEVEARAKKAGLWRGPTTVPPWEWRKTRK